MYTASKNILNHGNALMKKFIFPFVKILLNINFSN